MIRRFASWNARMHRDRVEHYDRRPYLMVGLLVLRGALYLCSEALQRRLRLQRESIGPKPAASRADHVASLAQLLREQEAAGSPSYYVDGSDGIDTCRAANAAAAAASVSAFPRSLDEWLHPVDLTAVPVPGGPRYGAMVAWARHRQFADPLFLGALGGHGLLAQAASVLRADEPPQQRAVASLLGDLGVEVASIGGVNSPFTWWVDGTEIIPDIPPASSEP